MNEIGQFFKEIGVSKEDKSESYFENLLYLCCAEFGWNQEDFLNTDIPFLLDLLYIRIKVLEKQESEARKNKRR